MKMTRKENASPDLANLLRDYMNLRKAERSDWSRYGQQKGTMDDLKAVSQKIIEQKVTSNIAQKKKSLEADLHKFKSRNEQLLLLFEKLFEDNTIGKISDEWFKQLSNKYAIEQQANSMQISKIEADINQLDDMANKQLQFTKTVQKLFNMKYLNPILLRELIEKIEVYHAEGSGKSKIQRIIIHYRFLGVLDIPNEFQGNNVFLETRDGVAIEYIATKEKSA